jgi:Flp pilus assembly protein TadD
MNLMRHPPRICGIVVCWFLAGCAASPVVESSIADDELRNTTMDVMFATKFPVASEEEAIAKATSALRAGETDKALFFYVRALQFNPEDVELLALIGDIHMQRNDLARARRAYEQARSVDPEHARSLEALGLIYMAEGKDEEAIAELSNATALDDSRWRAHNALGVYFDKTGDYASAQYHYDSALAQNPAAGQVLNNRGYSKYLAGDLGGATIDLRTAATERGFELAWANLGLVYASQGRYEDAISAYEEIMGEANAYSNAGQVAMNNGDLGVAEYYFDEAVRLSPTYFPQAEKSLQKLQTLRRAGMTDRSY